MNVEQWTRRAAELAAITSWPFGEERLPLLTQSQWMQLLAHFPDISDTEVRAAWRVWSEITHVQWTEFAHYLRAAVDIREETADEYRRTAV